MTRPTKWQQARDQAFDTIDRIDTIYDRLSLQCITSEMLENSMLMNPGSGTVQTMQEWFDDFIDGHWPESDLDGLIEVEFVDGDWVQS